MTALRAIVVGASGGIGAALADSLEAGGYHVTRLSRSSADPELFIDLEDEGSITRAAARHSGGGGFALIIVASGVLKGEGAAPEKSFQQLNEEALARYFAVNTTGPALVAKHFLPLLVPSGRSVFAALSARVGSISDNRLGGWYGYRASKAALNMIIKSLAIELARKRPESVCVALHPGTVDTALSKPFQSNVPASRLFTPAFAAERLVHVIDALTPQDSGGCFAWDGQRIAP